MQNEKDWARALARFEAFRANPPRSIDQRRVDEYHSLVDALELASGEDLGSFRIPASEMKPKLVSWTPGTIRRPSRVQMSDKPYCDDHFFKRQVDGLWNFVRVLSPRTDPPRSGVGEIDYSALTDFQLQELEVNYRISPARRVDADGEHYYFDRSHFIRELYRRDGIEWSAPAKAQSPASSVVPEIPTDDSQPVNPQVPKTDFVPKTAARLDPEVAKRRVIVRQNPDLQAQGLCELFDSSRVPLPKSMREAGSWAKAYRAPSHRHAIDVLIARDRRESAKQESRSHA